MARRARIGRLDVAFVARSSRGVSGSDGEEVCCGCVDFYLAFVAISIYIINTTLL
jgi:hypothetical protein